MLTRVSSSEGSIWGLLGDTFGHEKVENRSRDIILRPISLRQINKIKMRGFKICRITFKSSHRPKSMVSGAIFGGFDNQSGLCERQLWHDWVGCGCVSGFKSPKIHHHCLRTKMRWFSTYPKHRTQRTIAKL